MDRRRLTFVCTGLVRGPYWTFFILAFFFFSFLFFNLKLPITPFFYFVIQFNIKTFEKKNYNLIIRLFPTILNLLKVIIRGQVFFSPVSGRKSGMNYFGISKYRFLKKQLKGFACSGDSTIYYLNYLTIWRCYRFIRRDCCQN